jgi:hypothetical protein
MGDPGQAQETTMNIMTDIWTTFGRDQGQMVERSYRYDMEADAIVKRTRDRSYMLVVYEAAPCPDHIEIAWSGAEGGAPWDDGELDWRPCQNPFDD